MHPSSSFSTSHRSQHGLSQPNHLQSHHDTDLDALWERDTLIFSTFARFDRATCYCDGNQGEKRVLEGRMVLYERNSYPVYGLCILNDQDVILHMQHLYPEDDISVHHNRLRIESYPEFTDRRLASASSSTTNKFSNVYLVSNLESLQKYDESVSRTIELSSSAADMSRVLFRLHSYIKLNKPYMKEMTPEPHRIPKRKPIVSPISLPIAPSPAQSTSYSPSPSTLFSSMGSSPFSTPPTSAAPSPSPFRSPCPAAHFPQPHHRNRDYRHIALLHQLLPSQCLPPGAWSQPVKPIREEGPDAMPAPTAACPPSSSGLRVSVPVSRQVPASRKHLPPCTELRNMIKKIDQHPFAGGGSSDLFKGRLLNCAYVVAIKVLRLPSSNGSQAAMEILDTHLDRESKVWAKLDHTNVLPLLGYCRDFGPYPALISPYCHHRDLAHYFKNNPHANRSFILIGFTDGLSYLHSQNVIHGDLKPNVLIGENGEPLISDFGVSKIIDCQGFTTRFSGTPSFMAPELFPDYDEQLILDEDSIEDDVFSFTPEVTKETDVFAYGLVSLQILTNKCPKSHYFGTPKTQLLPRRRWYDPKLTKSRMSDQQWNLFKSCCDLDPKKRPTMNDMMQRIRAAG